MKVKIPFFFSTLSLFLLIPSNLEARNLEEYWYGIGIGTAELLCYLKSNGMITDNYMNTYMRNYIANAKSLDQSLVRLKNFNDGIKLVNNVYPSCNIRFY